MLPAGAVVVQQFVLQCFNRASGTGTKGAVDPRFTTGLLLGFGVVSMIIGTFSLVIQRHYKRMLAYSSIEHMGLVSIGLALGPAGVFAAWDFREELEYGITDRATVAGYLNFRSTHSEGVTGLADEDGFEFEGISTELKYLVLNPNTKALGVLLYGEATYNGDEFELEEKLVLQRNLGEKWVTAFNVTLEEEWAFTPAATDEELTLELTAGVAYKINSHWSVGIEGRNHREFTPGLDFRNQEHSAWFVGPNVHYGRDNWWATLTVLPQVHGSPETRNGLQLDHHEKIEVRLLVGVNF